MAPWIGLVLLATLAEGSTLAAKTGVFRQGWRVAGFTATFLLLFWAGALGVLLALGRALARRSRRWPRAARPCLLAGPLLLMVPLFLLYLASWGVYLRIGQFLNYEALEYALRDYRSMTWFYVKLSEPLSLLALGAAVAAGLALTAVALAIASREGNRRPSRSGRVFRLAWSGVLVLCVFFFARIFFDSSEIRRPTEMETLRRSINPFLSLAVSWWESRSEEPVEPCLRAAELFPIAATRWAPPAASDRNRPSIVFLKIESLRHDVVGQSIDGKEIAPNISRLSRDGFTFTRAYAQATHTDYSDVSTLSSLYPLRTRRHHYYEASDPWPKKLIWDLLKPAGYESAVIAAENLAWGRLDQFLITPGLGLFFDSERSGRPTRVPRQDSGIAEEVRRGVLSGGTLDDETVTDRALDWLSRQAASGRPFFLNLDLQSSHFPYSLPLRIERPFQPWKINFNVSFIWYPARKTPIVRNAYYNAVHEADRQVGRVIDALRRLGRLEKTILVIYGDHGEAFNEAGQVTHGGPPIEVTARVACVVFAPAYFGRGREDYPMELIDLVPTVLGRAGWPAHPNQQGIDVLAQDRPPVAHRLLFLHTENPLSHTDAVILGARWKLTINRQTGRQTLNDLASDPSGETDVSAQRPEEFQRLLRLLRAWRARQLAYYAYPTYYTQYYPPRPPT